MASVVNRSQYALHGLVKWMFLFVGAAGVAHLSVMIIEPTWLANMHTADCYLAVALVIPAMLIASGWGAARG